MQTFLPYPDFVASAGVLDRARLGKQRVETLQVLRALRFADYGWQSHPAVRMWRGHVEALVTYGQACVDEWSRRGFPDTCGPQIAEFHPGARPQATLAAAGALPVWIGDEDVHRSHQSALLRKDPATYRQAFPDVPDDLPYVWPTPAGAAPEVPAGPFSGWAVRTDDAHAPRLALVGGKGRKWEESAAAYVDDVQVGDVVVVAQGEEVAVGRITGPAQWHDGRPSRPVRWTGSRPRASLRDPVALQNPRPLSALYGEDLGAA